MGGTPIYAHCLTMSTNIDFLGSWTEEVHKWMKKHTMWYAIKVEEGDGEAHQKKLHLHAGFVFEIATNVNGDLPYVGAKRCDNLKASFYKTHFPLFTEYVTSQPAGTKYALEVHPMSSDHWLSTYMRKEGEMVYHRLPADYQELMPYFADLQSKKKQYNPQYDVWMNMYHADGREEPATIESLMKFFLEHMHIVPYCIDNPIMAVTDNRKLMERCKNLKVHINQEIDFDDFMPKTKRARNVIEDLRQCPRCIEKDKDVPNILGPREQFCFACKKY